MARTRAGSHSLRYFATAMTRPGLREPRFLSVGYVDDEQFVRFDTANESQRMEPRAAWVERMGREDPEYWERETLKARKNAEFLLRGLQILRSYFNQSEDGVHTFQATYGCEVTSEHGFRRGFHQYAYNGRDYLALDREMNTWTATMPPAENTKRKWEAERSVADSMKAYLEHKCVLWLKKYLDMGKERLQRADPPSARVTRHGRPRGELTLRCQAWNFYPSKISLTWLRNGEYLLQDTEVIDTRPAGDNTFQTWAAVGVSPGREGEYTCRVQHEGLPEPLALQWEPPSLSPSYIVGGIAGLVLLIAVIAGLVIWRRKTPDGKGGYALAAGNDSAQGTDVSLQESDETLGASRGVEFDRNAWNGPENQSADLALFLLPSGFSPNHLEYSLLSMDSSRWNQRPCY